MVKQRKVRFCLEEDRKVECIYVHPLAILLYLPILGILTAFIMFLVQLTAYHTEKRL